MIVVRVELHSAVTGQVTEIGKMIISNDGTSNDPDVGSYDVRLGRRGDTDIMKVYHHPQREGRVVGHQRLKKPVWALVSRALASVGFHSRKFDADGVEEKG